MLPFATRIALILPLLAALALSPSSAAAAPASAPNFLVFIADDQGPGDLSCYGHPVLRTPAIDRLAAGGVRFDAACLTTSSCSPSRSSILTGRYPHSTAAEDLHTPLPAEQWTVARYLRPAGYHTMAAGKWHLGDAEKANWDVVRDAPAPQLDELAIGMLRDRPADKPFFMWVASHDPHRKYGNDGIVPIHDPDTIPIPPQLPDHPLIRGELAQYYDEIARFDSQVALILDELERQQILDNTFIVYMSDNGMPFPRSKTTLYPAGIQSPLLMRYPPRIAAASVQPGLVSAVDLAPTFLDLAGVEQTTMQGRSLLPMLDDPTTRVRDLAFAEANWHDYEHFTRAVRDDRYLLIHNYYYDKPLWAPADAVNSLTWQGFLAARDAGALTPAQAAILAPTRPFEEFYHLGADPHAFISLAGDATVLDPADRAALDRLRVALENWRVETDDRMPAERRPDGFSLEGVNLRDARGRFLDNASSTPAPVYDPGAPPKQ